ncbi:hypothetical protein MKY25_06625 [Geobacillus sp. FSL W8-0032]|uniref:hypothetical protein n=1 Tax=Geobacillus TaxID=129337 RepID=UPI00103BD58F|nr:MULTISPECIES: hypothetical protein [Geobacillus]
MLIEKLTFDFSCNELPPPWLSLQVEPTRSLEEMMQRLGCTVQDNGEVNSSCCMYIEANLEDTTPDFKVLVDGVEKTVSGLTYDATTKSLNITFTTPVTDLSKPISLEVLSGNNVVDTTTPAV